MLGGCPGTPGCTSGPVGSSGSCGPIVSQFFFGSSITVIGVTTKELSFANSLVWLSKEADVLYESDPTLFDAERYQP